MGAQHLKTHITHCFHFEDDVYSIGYQDFGDVQISSAIRLNSKCYFVFPPDFGLVNAIPGEWVGPCQCSCCIAISGKSPRLCHMCTTCRSFALMMPWCLWDHWLSMGIASRVQQLSVCVKKCCEVCGLIWTWNIHDNLQGSNKSRSMWNATCRTVAVSERCSVDLPAQVQSQICCSLLKTHPLRTISLEVLEGEPRVFWAYKNLRLPWSRNAKVHAVVSQKQ